MKGREGKELEVPFYMKERTKAINKATLKGGRNFLIKFLKKENIKVLYKKVDREKVLEEEVREV